jgi:hypothetical protein
LYEILDIALQTNTFPRVLVTVCFHRNCSDHSVCVIDNEYSCKCHFG